MFRSILLRPIINKRGFSLSSSSLRHHVQQVQQITLRRCLSTAPTTTTTTTTTPHSFQLPTRKDQVLLGCVSYDPAVGDIWDQMKDYFVTHKNNVDFDFVLHTNYEQQVSALLEKRIDVAWNGPLAHVIAEEHLDTDKQDSIKSLGMRDVDCDFEFVVVVRKNTGIQCVRDLRGCKVLTGSSDSPQAHVVPKYWLEDVLGLNSVQFIPQEYDLGKHGDTAIGEIKALEQLLLASDDDHYAAAVVSNMMYKRGLEGQLEPTIDAKKLKETTTILSPDDEQPTLDHCQFDMLMSVYDANPSKFDAFQTALFDMDMNNPKHAPVMKLEGIRQCWMPYRPGGYDIVRSAYKHHMKQHNQQQRRYYSSSSSSSSGSARQTATSFSTTTSIRPTSLLRTTRNTTFSSTTTITTTSRRYLHVGVVGCGVAGLQVVRAMQENGHETIAFDKSSNVGGLWQTNYSGFGVQVPKQLYEFPDYPMNSVATGTYPTGPQVQEYIESYAKDFDLYNNLQLNTTVTKVEPCDDESGGWNFMIRDEATGKTRKQHFDYAVISTGMYSEPINLPTIANQDEFQGDIYHSSKFYDASVAVNKKVIIVGGAKSAVDLACEAYRAGAESVTLLQRRPHWPTPRKIAGLIPFQYIFLSRLGTALVSAHRGTYKDASSAVQLFRTIGWPVMVPVFKIVEAIFGLQFQYPKDLRPKEDVVTDFYGYAHVLDYELRDLRKSNMVTVQNGEIAQFTTDGVELTDGSKLDADIVVFATGFQKNYDIFPEQVQKSLDIQPDGLYLYRHMLPLAVPNLAFVGSEIATISNIMTYGIQAEWLARRLNGGMNDKSSSGLQPSTEEEMKAEVEWFKDWKRSWMPSTASRASLVLLHQTHYHDQLLKDMGENHLRKMPNFLAEYLVPYQPMDYDNIIGRSAARKSG